MFHNGRKTLGVFIQQVNEEYQNLICRGISKKAKELGYNTAIFTNFGGYGHEVYDFGERMIVNLPNYEELDGIILAPDTMNLSGLEELYKNQIRSRSHCPVVSIRKEREEFYNVLADNNTILEKIITHFIDVHKFTRINFLSGPVGFKEIDKRLEAYRRILTEHGIAVDEDRIYHGDLWRYEGYKAVDYWLDNREEWPQAIICANDVMAITVCKALAKKGIRVPEDIAVSGCDDIEESEEFIPAITTVRLPAVELGMEAVEIIHKHHLGINQPKNTYVQSTDTIYRASCGCNRDWYHEISDRRLLKIDLSDSVHHQITRIAQMSTDLTGLSSLDAAIDNISGNWFEYDYISHIYLCLKEDWDNYDKTEEDTPEKHMIMLSGLKNKVSCTRLKFQKKDLLPAELAEDQPRTYYFAVIHYLQHYFGYVAFSYEDENITGMLTLQAWLNNVSSVLENVRMHMEMNRLVNRLEDMSIRDDLTGLYNRRVIDTLGKKSLEQSMKDNSRLLFYIADMDKLKFINDKYGHAQGDIALNAVADALQKAADDDEICIRLGGDEFMVIGMDYNEVKAARFANRVVEQLNHHNKSNESEFEVYISYGWNLIIPDETTTIEECLFTADYRMYQQKYNKVSNNIKANLFA